MNFRKDKAVWTAVGVGLVFGAVAIANNVTIPNSFTPGTPTSASQMNANFQAVKAAIDDTYTRAEADARPANLRSCHWKYRLCADAGVRCNVTCDPGYTVIGGGCDGVAGTMIQESYPGPSSGDYKDAGADRWPVGVSPSDPDLPTIDVWACTAASGGSFNSAYALCCATP